MQWSLASDDDKHFEVYRPPTTSGRLEPTYINPHPNEWRPSVSYKYPLNDIKNQFTPAEFFRHRLETAGREIRLIQKLEVRWTRHYEAFAEAAIKVQALFRGIKGRAHFRLIKADLERDLRIKRSIQHAQAAFLASLFEEAIAACRSLIGERSPTLLAIQLKAEYRAGKFEDCIATAEILIDLDRTNEQAYYLSACSYCRLNRLEEAFEKIRIATILRASCTDETYRLIAALATKLSPPQHERAVDSLSQILIRSPRDFAALIERAYCLCCIQQWTEAMEGVNLVLAFNPIDRKALLLKGRIHACTRDWEEAQSTYNFILLHHPGDATAQERLQEIQSGSKTGAVHVED